MIDTSNNFGKTESEVYIEEKKILSYDEALEKAGYGSIQRILVLVGGLIIFCSYVSVGSIAYVLPSAQCDLHMDSEEKGKVVSIFFLGLIISCHLWGFLSDTMGRHYILIRCLLIDGLLYFITSVTPYYSVILGLRLVHGFVASGCVAAVYAYIGEFFTEKKRSKLLMTAGMLAATCDTTITLCAWLTINGNWSFEVYPGVVFKSWRLYYFVSGVPSIVSFICLCFLPESPKYLLASGQKKESIDVLKWIHKKNRKNEVDEFLVKDIEIDENEKVAALTHDRNKALAFFKLVWDQTIPLFKRQHIVNLMLICSSQFFTFFTNGGIYLWLPETMNRFAIFASKSQNKYATYCDIVQFVAQPYEKNHTQSIQPISADNFFNTTDTIVVEKYICHDNVESVMYFYLAVVGLIVFTCTGVAGALMKVVNHRYILVTFTMASLWLAIGTQYVKVTAFSGYFPCFLAALTAALAPVLNSLAVELFPTNLCGMAGCLVLLFCRLGTVTTNVIAGYTIDNNCRGFVWTVIVINALCFITSSCIPSKIHKTSEKEDEINQSEK